LIVGLGIELKATDQVIVHDDARRVAGQIREVDADFIIVLILSWVEAPNVMTAVGEYLHKPILLWSHTTWQENGHILTLGPIPGAGVVRGTLEQMGADFIFVYGQPDAPTIGEKIRLFARAAYARRAMARSRIGLLGYISMGMYPATFDHVSIRRDLGPEIDQLDQYVLVKKMEEIWDVGDLVKKARQEWDITEAVGEEDLVKTMRMYQALKDLAAEGDWSALTIKCQYELSIHYGFTPCVPLSIIGDELTASCEGDIPLIVTQLLMHYLMDEPAAVSYGDVHDPREKSILFGACGYAPFCLAAGRPRVDKHTALYQGLLNSTVYKEGRVTLARLAVAEPGWYRLHVVTGEARTPPVFHEVGCPAYPSMEVFLDSPVDHFMQNLGSQHYAVAYGDLRPELETFCRLRDIEIV
jgi:L-fucose isomerase-like protein